MRRTTLITATSVVGIVIAGATAIGANIGILSAAEANPVGELSAAAPVEPTEQPADVDGSLDQPGTTGIPASGEVTAFAVASAGTVAVAQVNGTVRLGDVVANPGWTWSSSQDEDTSLMVTFASADATYEFVASLGPDNAIQARVDQPIVQTVQSGSGAGYGDDYDEPHDGGDGDRGREAYEGGDDDD